MRNLLSIGILLAVIAGVLGFAFVKRAEKERVIAEMNLQSAEAERKIAEAEAKDSAAQAKKAEKEAEAAKAKADAAKADREAKALAKETANIEKANLAEKKKIADAESARAGDERKAAEEARLAEEAKTEAQRLAAEEAAANERAEAAKLQESEEARLIVEAETERRNAEIKLLELKRQDLDRLISENAELQNILRLREEETRPEKTVGDLIAENESGMEGEDEDGGTEGAKSRAQASVSVPRRKEDILLEEVARIAEERLGKASDSVRERAIRELEPLLYKAVREGRRDDAEFYLNNLLVFVPDYMPGMTGTSGSSKEEGAEK